MKRYQVVILVVFAAISIGLIANYIIKNSTHNDDNILEKFNELNSQLEKHNQIQKVRIDSLQHAFEETVTNYKIAELLRINEDLTVYIEDLKEDLLESLGAIDANDYEAMDGTDRSDSFLFTEDGYTEKGAEFSEKVRSYRIQAKLIVLPELSELQTRIDELFNNHSGVDDWLSYNFKDFPMVAVLTKLSTMPHEMDMLKREVMAKLKP